MNIDILKNNPAWWWYLPFATLTTVVTCIVWVTFKWSNSVRGTNRFYKNHPLTQSPRSSKGISKRDSGGWLDDQTETRTLKPESKGELRPPQCLRRRSHRPLSSRRTKRCEDPAQPKVYDLPYTKSRSRILISFGINPLPLQFWSFMTCTAFFVNLDQAEEIDLFFLS